MSAQPENRPEADVAPLDLGTPGASARREHERRRRNRERRTREQHPLVGGALFMLRDAPAHERAWEIGPRGEEATAAYLAKRCHRVLVLHDRAMPGSRGNIDHIAVAPSGVCVIDSKLYKRRRVRVAQPLFGASKLVIGGYDSTRLVEGLLRQVAVVAEAMAEIDDSVPVSGAFCFVDADIPLLGTPRIQELPVLNRRRLAKRLNAEGPLNDKQILGIATALAGRFGPA